MSYDNSLQTPELIPRPGDLRYGLEICFRCHTAGPLNWNLAEWLIPAIEKEYPNDEDLTVVISCLKATSTPEPFADMCVASLAVTDSQWRVLDIRRYFDVVCIDVHKFGLIDLVKGSV